MSNFRFYIVWELLYVFDINNLFAYSIDITDLKIAFTNIWFKVGVLIFFKCGERTSNDIF